MPPIRGIGAGHRALAPGARLQQVLAGLLALAAPVAAGATESFRCTPPGGPVYYGSSPLENAPCERITLPGSPPAPAPAAAPGRAPAAEPPATPATPATSATSATSAKPATPGTDAPPPSARPAPAPAPAQGPAGASAPASSRPAFIDEAANVLEFGTAQSLQQFRARWADTPRQGIRIAHFGDSHLQAGFAAEVLRNRLQAVRGRGGRGMVFPYALARTHSPNDYSSSFTGRWTTASSLQAAPKLPLGMTGFTARTGDSRGAVQFRFRKPLEAGPKRVQLLFTTTHPRVMVIASADGRQVSRTVTVAPDTAATSVELPLAGITNDLRIDFLSLADGRGTFDLHGVNIENAGTGLLHHSFGVGGASFGALGTQELFEAHASVLNPDVYILDWGTNDIISRSTVPESHRQTVVEAIRRIRARAPQALIVLVSLQDMRVKGQPVTVTAEYAKVMRAIAQEQGCLFWDWHRVSGGAGVIEAWYDAGLAQPDRIHLSIRGYQLRGALLAEALLRAFGAN